MNKAMLIVCLMLFECCVNKSVKNEKKEVPIINYSVQKDYPHDTSSFTEGLFVYKGDIFESTGSPEELPQTKSLFGIVDTISGKIDVKVEIDKRKYFGEGIAILKDKIYQITYKSNTGFIYSENNYDLIGEFKFPNKEGWGLTTNGTSLIMSDGTSNLSFFKPQNFVLEKTLKVFDSTGEVENLNELEYISGFIYANIYFTNKIFKIDPNSGEVVGQIDLASLAIEAHYMYPGSLEMNGIAYDEFSKTMIITGKMWPRIYRISFAH